MNANRIRATGFRIQYVHIINQRREDATRMRACFTSFVFFFLPHGFNERYWVGLGIENFEFKINIERA